MGEKFLVEISARHVHLSDEQVETLFGAGHVLTPKKYLSQPGAYVSEEKVEVVGPKSTIKMSVLGPTRKAAQVEVSFTDARALGVKAPVRESGDTAGSTPIKLVGPAGEIEIPEGVIVAKRHVHMTKEDAERLGVNNGDIVSVKIDTEARSLVYGDVVVRVRDDFKLAMHLDTDEGNAAGISGDGEGEIVK